MDIRQNRYGSFFTEIEINVVNKVVRKALAYWPIEDKADLEQELFMHLFTVRHSYITADKYANYVKTVAQRKVYNLIEKQTRKKQIPIQQVHRLFEPVGQTGVSLAEVIADQTTLPPDHYSTQLNADLWALVAGKHSLYSEILRYKLSGHTVTSMAQAINLNRTTVSTYYAELKKMIITARLDRYL